ncbi:MAG: hypothetical protein KAJ51_10275 [Thermoplasmata archaeon]|nr:hypothetical protein [Thermoplasmata archaeon]
MVKIRTKKKIFTTTIITALIFIVILVSMPLTSSQNGGMQVPSSPSPPPIEITGITFSNSEPLEGEEITIYVTVLNNGSTKVDNIAISFIIDSEELGKNAGITIEANESLTVDHTWTAEKWNHNVAAMVSIGDTPLQNSLVLRELFVDGKPIGDIPSLILAFIIILIVVIGVTVIPSVWETLIGVNKKKK